MKKLTLVLFVFIFLFSCNKNEVFNTGYLSSKYSSTTINRWMDLSTQLVRDNKMYSPPVAARVFGYLGWTYYESIVSGSDVYQSLGIQIAGKNLTRPKSGLEYNWEIAANAALRKACLNYFSYYGNMLNLQVETRVDSLYQQNKRVICYGISEGVIENSEAYGTLIADEIYNYSATDPVGHLGQLNNADPVYTMPAGDSIWEPTPPRYGSLVQPHWGDVRLFVNYNINFVPSLPCNFDTAKTSPMYLAALEVYNTNKNLTAEERSIAQYWSDGAGTITPPGHMIRICSQLLANKNADLQYSALTYCLVGMSLSDAFVVCWKTKYKHHLLRPITYIQRYISASFKPIILTPPFPSFVSGHATQSAAACVIFSKMFGEKISLVDHTNDKLEMEPRKFYSVKSIAEEAANSRLFGGIHYKFDNEIGLQVGEQVGNEILKLNYKKK